MRYMIQKTSNLNQLSKYSLIMAVPIDKVIEPEWVISEPEDPQDELAYEFFTEVNVTEEPMDDYFLALFLDSSKESPSGSS